MLNEAGKKTGQAIGNKLFPGSTDYLRIGSLGDENGRLEADLEVQQERMEMEHQSALQQAMIRLHFDSRDIEHNVSVLTQIAAIIDSLPNRFQRSEMEQKTYKMAKSMIQSGIVLCKRIDASHPMVAYFDSKYN